MFMERFAYSLMVSACLSVLSGGCGAQVASTGARRTDLRATQFVGASEPRVLLAGPGWLLHVNSERRGAVVVYRVPKKDGTAADCGNPAFAKTAAKATIKKADALGRLSLYVRAGEVACAAVPRSARLSWHAQALPFPDATQEAVASFP